jgi:hypothetical protein
MKYFNRHVSRHMSSSVSVLATITAMIPSCAHAHYGMYLSAFYATLSFLLWLTVALMCLFLLRAIAAALLTAAAGVAAWAVISNSALADVYPLRLDARALILHSLAILLPLAIGVVVLRLRSRAKFSATKK